MRYRQLLVLCLVALVAGLAACSTEPPQTVGERMNLHDQAVAAVKRFQFKDPGLHHVMDEAGGYAIFPDVTKAGLVFGGASGQGEVYRNNQSGNATMIGYAEIAQGTFGAQIGGQSYSELILFENDAAIERFKDNNFALAAQASAVAAAANSSANANYENGVLVFTLGNGGLMAEAVVGGQKFHFHPVNQ